MQNLPDSLYEEHNNLKLTCSSSSAAASAASTDLSPPSIRTICRWIQDLQNPVTSDSALQNLVNNRNNFEALPLLLWSSSGLVTMLLQEVIGIFRDISLPTFSEWIPTRVYNALLLFQCISLHPDTRAKFLKAKMPHYFYPLMDIAYTDKPREWLRLGALGVIAQLVKAPGNEAAVRFLMDSGAFRYCIKPIEIGSTESKTLAIFILHKIMLTDEGLQYCCVLADRYFIIDRVLKKLLVHLSSMSKPPSNLIKLVTACYLRLSNKSRAREGLRRYLPVLLFDNTFASLFAEDPVADSYRKQLIQIMFISDSLFHS